MRLFHQIKVSEHITEVVHRTYEPVPEISFNTARELKKSGGEITQVDSHISTPEPKPTQVDRDSSDEKERLMQQIKKRLLPKMAFQDEWLVREKIGAGFAIFKTREAAINHIKSGKNIQDYPYQD
jgi:hypothetical protein